MAAWSLDDAEWDALDELRFSTSDADVFRNATMILMSGTIFRTNARLFEGHLTAN